MEPRVVRDARHEREGLAVTRPCQHEDSVAYLARLHAVVVGAGLSFGASTLADRDGAAYVYIAFTLWGIRSRAHPPAPLPVFGLPRWGNGVLWAGVARLLDYALKDVLTRQRRAHGLGPVDAWHSIHGSRTLLAQDETLGALPADVVGCIGRVPALTSLEPLVPPSAEVEEFLGDDAEKGRARRVYSQVLRITDSDHRALFPRMDLVVHHGGAGTTATALRAGAPQLLVPHIQDQFAHGRRIAELGLGPKPLPKAKLTTGALVAALEASDRYRQRAREVAVTLAGQSGARAAAEAVERSFVEQEVFTHS